MYARLLKIFKNQSIFLFGPRGTGKSTWVKKKFTKAIYIDLLEGDYYTSLLANPDRLETMIPLGFKNYIIIDEIQRIPDLLNEVHRLIETQKYIFILTGSSARKLRKKGVNLLAGRALTYHLYPLTIKELKDKFCLEHSLRYGHLPMVYKKNINAKKYLSSYVKTYLREEVLQEGLVRNLEPFSRFLEAASFSQGSIVNITEIARECSVNRKVVENYFSILEDLLIGEFLHVFTKKAKRRMISHPKFYFFDVGIYRSIRPRGPLDKPEEIEGISYETLFYQELKAINE